MGVRVRVKTPFMFSPPTRVQTLRSGGWIENVETSGLGQGERQSLEANGRRMVLKLKPRPGQPREASQNYGARANCVHLRSEAPAV